MYDWLAILISGLAGAVLGLAFFWGLWATVSRLRKARHPALWMLSSLTARFAMVLAGFYWLTRYGGWEHVLAALIGFTILRLVMIRRLRPQQTKNEPEL